MVKQPEIQAGQVTPEIQAGQVTSAVQEFLKEVGARDPKLASAPEAAIALSMAERMDDPHNSATSASMCAGRMLDALGKLREMMPEDLAESPLDRILKQRDDELSKRRGKRASG